MLFDVQEEMEDRFGDIPPATQNLIDIAFVKALCSHAQVSSLTVREGNAKLQFHPQALLDGARMLQAAANIAAQLLPGEAVSLLYKKPGADVEGMLHALPPLLEALCAAYKTLSKKWKYPLFRGLPRKLPLGFC
jgi:transcription-repair coupling factor (superfamily II helicase)